MLSAALRRQPLNQVHKSPWKHGYYSAAEKRKRKEVHALIREMRSLMRELGA